MRDMKHTMFFFIFLTLFLSCLLIGCNDSDSDSDKPKSIDVEKTWYRDADGDGYGDPSMSQTQIAQPSGYVDNSGDCNDYDAAIFPGASELCDGKDNNCSGVVDEGACGPDLQKVSGRIINLSEAQAYINDDAYLQLVPYPADGQLVFTTDGQGRRVYSSDLATLDIPNDGLFLFEASGLIFGDYVVAAQRLNPYGPNSDALPILSDDDDQPVIFSVSANGDTALDVDLGNVRLPVPELIVKQIENGLAPPNGVSASDGAFEDKIRVTWNASPGATAYEVYRAGSFAGQKVRIAITAATTYDDMSSSSCGEDNYYYYWVKAVSASGASDLFYSDLGFVRCPFISDSQPPGADGEDEGDDAGTPPEDLADKPVILDAPTGTDASDGAYPDKISISWKAVPSATSYDVYRCLTCCGAKKKIGSSNTASYDDFYVTLGEYYYWIKANNASGTSEFSFPDTGYIMTPPPVPIGVKASDGTYLNQVLVVWNKTPTASIYEIYRSDWPGAEKTLLGKTSSTQFFDTDLECSTHKPPTYFYSVMAANDAGISNFSDEDSGYVYRTLRDPVWIRASEGLSNCVTITWNTIPGAKRYDVYRSDSDVAEKIKLVSVNHPLNSFLDSTSTGSKIYYYWVRAIDARGYTSCIFGNYDIGYCFAE